MAHAIYKSRDCPDSVTTFTYLFVQAGEAIDKSLRFVSGNQRTPSKLIEDIKNQYANTKQSLEALDKPYDLEIAKEHVSKLINFYYKILTTNSKAMNPMNLTIMLHHFATIAKSTSLENWVIEAHGDFVETLTSEVIILSQPPYQVGERENKTC